MPIIKVFNDNNRNYSVTSQGNVLGMLRYRHWYSSKAYITLGNDDEYNVVRKGFWGNTHEVKQNDSVVFILKAQFNGGIAIIKPNDKEHFYEFKPNAIFTDGYVLTNYKGEELLLMTTDYSWKKFTTGYNISYSDNFGASSLEHLLIMISVYHYKAAQVMAVAAVAN
jgi:hypothetical protein